MHNEKKKQIDNNNQVSDIQAALNKLSAIEEK